MRQQFVTIEFDKPYRMRFSHNTMADIEDQAGAGIEMLFNQRRGFSVLRYLVWAGIRHGDHAQRGITLERAGDLIDIYAERHGELDSLTDRLLDAMIAAGVWKPEKPKAEESQAEGSEGNGTTEATTAQGASATT